MKWSAGEGDGKNIINAEVVDDNMLIVIIRGDTTEQDDYQAPVISSIR